MRRGYDDMPRISKKEIYAGHEVAEIIEKIEIIHEEKAIKIFEIYCFISNERDTRTSFWFYGFLWKFLLEKFMRSANLDLKL